MTRCGIGEMGELYMRSPHMAAGYLGLDDATRLKFLQNPFNPTNPRDRLYRTGDIGRYLPDGVGACMPPRDDEGGDPSCLFFSNQVGMHGVGRLGGQPSVRAGPTTRSRSAAFGWSWARSTRTCRRCNAPPGVRTCAGVLEPWQLTV
jgi:acyl-CoA synthetase (AMP-forming)/AMP-acid ligase II